MILAIGVILLLAIPRRGNQVIVPVTEQDSYLAQSTVDTVSNCRTTGLQRGSFTIFPMRELVGEFELTVVSVKRSEGHQAARGQLTLWQNSLNDSTERIRYPVNGLSKIDLTQLGPLPLAYSPATMDPAKPGVQIVHNPSQGSIVMVFGNALSNKVVTRDAGVYFEMSEVTDSGFDGTWRSGGRNPAAPSGVFCSRRIRTPTPK
jgi:hypothetical protein